MSQFELDAALKAVFEQCDTAACPLSDQQKHILRQVLQELVQDKFIAVDRAGSAGAAPDLPCGNEEFAEANPLDQLLPEERQRLLEFIRQQDKQNQPWKITLLNDWLQGKDSGSVQFLRERYGIQWLDQIKPVHLACYDGLGPGEVLKLKVGDRIEVTNGLWEWVQEEGPCSREWFPCTVLSISEPDKNATNSAHQGERLTRCVVRFDTGAEYEIQGIYDWNRPNWRWLQE